MWLYTAEIRYKPSWQNRQCRFPCIYLSSQCFILNPNMEHMEHYHTCWSGRKFNVAITRHLLRHMCCVYLINYAVLESTSVRCFPKVIKEVIACDRLSSRGHVAPSEGVSHRYPAYFHLGFELIKHQPIWRYNDTVRYYYYNTIILYYYV